MVAVDWRSIILARSKFTLLTEESKVYAIGEVDNFVNFEYVSVCWVWTICFLLVK